MRDEHLDMGYSLKMKPSTSRTIQGAANRDPTIAGDNIWCLTDSTRNHRLHCRLLRGVGMTREAEAGVQALFLMPEMYPRAEVSGDFMHASYGNARARDVGRVFTAVLSYFQCAAVNLTLLGRMCRRGVSRTSR